MISWIVGQLECYLNYYCFEAADGGRQGEVKSMYVSELPVGHEDWQDQ